MVMLRLPGGTGQVGIVGMVARESLLLIHNRYGSVRGQDPVPPPTTTYENPDQSAVPAGRPGYGAVVLAEPDRREVLPVAERWRWA